MLTRPIFRLCNSPSTTSLVVSVTSPNNKLPNGSITVRIPSKTRSFFKKTFNRAPRNIRGCTVSFILSLLAVILTSFQMSVTRNSENYRAVSHLSYRRKSGTISRTTRPMELQTEQFELANAQKEYGHYFLGCDLKSLPNSLHIVTAELKNLVVTVSLQGWSHANGENIYETFEALMMAISPGFQASFSNLLSAKLLALTKETPL